jgi:hypothetical protein
MDRTRFQLVLDAFEEDCFFILGGSTKGDDVNFLGRFGMNERDRYTTQEA